MRGYRDENREVGRPEETWVVGDLPGPKGGHEAGDQAAGHGGRKLSLGQAPSQMLSLHFRSLELRVWAALALWDR